MCIVRYVAARDYEVLLVGTAELRLHTRGHRADVPGEDLLCRCCPARVREGPFHFAFGCQDRADLVRRLRAALGTPPAKSDGELFRWLMSTEQECLGCECNMTRILNVCRSAVVWLIDDGVFVLTLPSQGGAMGQFSYRPLLLK